MRGSQKRKANAQFLDEPVERLTCRSFLGTHEYRGLFLRAMFLNEGGGSVFCATSGNKEYVCVLSHFAQRGIAHLVVAMFKRAENPCVILHTQPTLEAGPISGCDDGVQTQIIQIQMRESV
jgi:hypothetical protein